LRCALVCVLTAPATTQISTLSLHDALPISHAQDDAAIETLEVTMQLLREGATVPDAVTRIELPPAVRDAAAENAARGPDRANARSEEHTSELQSRENLVCRLLLEKKKRPSE